MMKSIMQHELQLIIESSNLPLHDQPFGLLYTMLTFATVYIFTESDMTCMYVIVCVCVCNILLSPIRDNPKYLW